MKITVKYVVEDRDRHGNLRLYYRKAGQPKVRLRGPMGSPEFWQDYQAALKNPKPKAKPKAPAGPDRTTMRWLISEYYASADFLQLDESTRVTRRRVLERFCLNQNDGDKPYALILPRHIRARRDAMVETPSAANTLLKALRVVFKHALRNDLVTSNPAAVVETFPSNGEGFHSWTMEEVEQYEACHPIGTTARLALALALFTGQRRSDLVRLGPPHLKNDWLIFTQYKNRNRNPVRLEIPACSGFDRGHRSLDHWRQDIPDHRIWKAIHHCRVWRQGPRLVRCGRFVPLFDPRGAQSRRRTSGRAWLQRVRDHVDHRSQEQQRGDDLHAGRPSKGQCASRVEENAGRPNREKPEDP
jgi:integrase